MTFWLYMYTISLISESFPNRNMSLGELNLIEKASSKFTNDGFVGLRDWGKPTESYFVQLRNSEFTRITSFFGHGEQK